MWVLSIVPQGRFLQSLSRTTIAPFVPPTKATVTPTFLVVPDFSAMIWLAGVYSVLMGLPSETVQPKLCRSSFESMRSTHESALLLQTTARSVSPNCVF